MAIAGNFVNRAIVLTHKYFNGVVPQPGTLADIDRETLAKVTEIKTRLTETLETFHFRDALFEAMNIARLGNKYLQETEPWKVAKTDIDRTAAILYTALQLCADMAVAFEPFMPFTAARLDEMLSVGKLEWSLLGRDDIVKAGTALKQPELLFEKIDNAPIEAQIKRLDDIKKENQLKNWTPQPQKNDVDFDTFARNDIRVGTVLECKRVPKTDRLLQFLIDDGMEKRTIVSGIAKFYQPEDLVGKQLCFIANLPPRKLKGIVSQGMILSAENADGSLVVIAPSGPVVPGAQVG